MLPERRSPLGRAPTREEAEGVLSALVTPLPEAGAVAALAAGVEPQHVLDLLRSAPGTDAELTRAVEHYDGGIRAGAAGGVAGGGGAPRPRIRIRSMGLRPFVLVALAGRVP
jgi:hypothetical protein